MAEDPDLPELIRRASAGNRDAGDRLFARAADRVLLFIRLRLGQGLRARFDPQDVLQEVFTHAHRDLARFDTAGTSDPERGFVHWLCALAEHRIRDLAAYHRARRRDPAREARDVTAVLRELHRSGHGPATSLVRREQRDRLGAAIDALDDADRAVLLMRFFEGLTLEQIAERSGQSPSSVRRALGRATARLGRDLGDEPSHEVTR
ncbi:MAG: sigma-70 family RNA polymerase sigma factor [Planctomycetes bacterium]|nr:sigma-70 family RNA polymerase sigma factor [Planctomycetota bacterium]